MGAQDVGSSKSTELSARRKTGVAAGDVRLPIWLLLIANGLTACVLLALFGVVLVLTDRLFFNGPGTGPAHSGTLARLDGSEPR